MQAIATATLHHDDDTDALWSQRDFWRQLSRWWDRNPTGSTMVFLPGDNTVQALADNTSTGPLTVDTRTGRHTNLPNGARVAATALPTERHTPWLLRQLLHRPLHALGSNYAVVLELADVIDHDTHEPIGWAAVIRTRRHTRTGAQPCALQA